MSGKCVFNNKWIEKPMYNAWLQCDINNHYAKCKLCSKSFSIAKMGESALKSHMKSKKHCELVQLKSSSQISTLLHMQSKNASVVSEKAAALPSSSSNIIDHHVSKNNVLDAEIIWTFKTIKQHISYKSNENIEKIFQLMFPDSMIASKFSCGEKKTAYYAVFGIAPYLKDCFLQDLKKKENYVLLFDESLNKMRQKKQMDVHIRFWQKGTVKTNYLTSVFLGHGTSEDLLSGFTDAIASLSLSKVLQVSMDGPNVNLKFFNLLQEELFKDFRKQLLNIGTCGLHVVHNAFKEGSYSSGWEIHEFMKSSYFLFKDSPARREDYEKVNQSGSFPKKFVNHRWLENVPVCEALLQILPHLEKYMAAVKKKEFKAPQCKSFSTVKSHLNDVLIVPKLQVFLSIAKILHPFLISYQTDKPMIFFLGEDLAKLINHLLQRFVKPEIVKATDTILKIVKLDVEDAKHHMKLEKIDLGFAAEKSLKMLIKEKKVSDKQVFDIRMQCKLFLISVIKKLIDKSPINFTLVRNLSCLDPRSMGNCNLCLKKFRIVLSILEDSGHICEEDCDKILSQFQEFLTTVVTSKQSKFLDFNLQTMRVDELFFESMNCEKFSMLWSAVEKLLLLSHGQAAVERGFSINKKIEVENMKELTYVSQRLICEHLNNVGEIHNLNITKELRTYVANARMRYSVYLEDLQKKNSALEKRKKEDDDMSQFEELKNKKQRVQKDIEALINSADSYAQKAEKDGNVTLIATSNSLRKTAYEKKHEIVAIDKLLEELKKK